MSQEMIGFDVILLSLMIVWHLIATYDEFKKGLKSIFNEKEPD